MSTLGPGKNQPRRCRHIPHTGLRNQTWRRRPGGMPTQTHSPLLMSRRQPLWPRCPLWKLPQASEMSSRRVVRVRQTGSVSVARTFGRWNAVRTSPMTLGPSQLSPHGTHGWRSCVHRWLICPCAPQLRQVAPCGTVTGKARLRVTGKPRFPLRTSRRRFPQPGIAGDRLQTRRRRVSAVLPPRVPVAGRALPGDALSRIKPRIQIRPRRCRLPDAGRNRGVVVGLRVKRLRQGRSGAGSGRRPLIPGVILTHTPRTSA